jgi:hypothetical protein
MNAEKTYLILRRTTIKLGRGIVNVILNPVTLPFVVVPFAMEGIRRLSERQIPENFTTVESGAFVVLGVILLVSVGKEIGKIV